MTLETGWLLSALTLQVYVPGATGFVITCGMFVSYVAYYATRLRRTSALVFWVSLSLGLGSIGGLTTGQTLDIFQPLHLSLAALAIMGVFVSEYHREELQFLAWIIAILLQVAVALSISRNGLLEEWAEGGRRGVNLQGLFLMLAASYALLLGGGWKLLALPLYGALFYLGSRTSFVTSLIVPILCFALNQKLRKEVLRKPFILCIVVGALVTGIYLWSQVPANSARLSLDSTRHSSSALKEGFWNRFDLSQYWLKFLIQNPTFFGNGYESYSSRNDSDPSPDNGFLHILNGLGVFSGIIYFAVCSVLFRRLWLSRNRLLPHMTWAGAFSVGMILRHFGEAQFLVYSTHVAGFAITYGTGLAILFSEQRPKSKEHYRQFGLVKAYKGAHKT